MICRHPMGKDLSATRVNKRLSKQVSRIKAEVKKGNPTQSHAADLHLKTARFARKNAPWSASKTAAGQSRHLFFICWAQKGMKSSHIFPTLTLFQIHWNQKR